MPPALILTLKFDAATFAALDGLRRQHFPPERNFIPAHVTLFHALPGEQEAALRQTLVAECAATAPFPLLLPRPHFMGRGVALVVECPPLRELRGRLAAAWQPTLGPQDRQGYRPHVTIQNKVDSAQARQLYEQLTATWQPLEGQGEGLLLWRYLGGPWELVEEFAFKTS
ncbi:MAG: 2'-5' RNA ligase family protein [Chloroflexaceae bacterium]|jgi:2'-5' RNA ligase|nr:2'-5' RNA ligase family protein [Chloroflexaceae bacterium]